MGKPVVATAHFTGCFGCHMSFLDIDERILELIELVDIDKSPINDIKGFERPFDIALIEGGVSNSENYEFLRKFRENTKIMISVGECATQGNIPKLRNMMSLRECLEEAFLKGPTVVDGVIPNDPDIPVLFDKVYPCHEVVKIDYFLPGCPPSADTIWAALTALLNGEEPSLPYSALKYD